MPVSLDSIGVVTAQPAPRPLTRTDATDLDTTRTATTFHGPSAPLDKPATVPAVFTATKPSVLYLVDATTKGHHVDAVPLLELLPSNVLITLMRTNWTPHFSSYGLRGTFAAYVRPLVAGAWASPAIEKAVNDAAYFAVDAPSAWLWLAHHRWATLLLYVAPPIVANNFSDIALGRTLQRIILILGVQAVSEDTGNEVAFALAPHIAHAIATLFSDDPSGTAPGQDARLLLHTIRLGLTNYVFGPNLFDATMKPSRALLYSDANISFIEARALEFGTPDRRPSSDALALLAALHPTNTKR